MWYMEILPKKTTPFFSTHSRKARSLAWHKSDDIQKLRFFHIPPPKLSFHFLFDPFGDYSTISCFVLFTAIYFPSTSPTDNGPIEFSCFRAKNLSHIDPPCVVSLIRENIHPSRYLTSFFLHIKNHFIHCNLILVHKKGFFVGKIIILVAILRNNPGKCW